MPNQSYFETRFQKFSRTRAGGLVDTKLMARLETVSEELNQTLCIEGAVPSGYLEARLRSSWDNFLSNLEEIHDQI